MKAMAPRLAAACILISALAPSRAAAQAPDGAAIVVEMDRRLNFAECSMTISISDAKAGGKPRQMRARVEYCKGAGTRVEFLEPARDKGKLILMSGSSMWMASPSVSKPVRLSGKDSFMGTTLTNDDVMNLDKSDDYDSVVISSDGGSWLVAMTARSQGLPYPRIEARIGRDYLPISMTYFARSGKESKRVSFSSVRDFGKRPRPSVMTIVDLMRPGDSSTMVFEEIAEGKVDRSRLNPASLGQ